MYHKNSVLHGNSMVYTTGNQYHIVAAKEKAYSWINNKTDLYYLSIEEGDNNDIFHLKVFHSKDAFMDYMRVYLTEYLTQAEQLNSFLEAAASLSD